MISRHTIQLPPTGWIVQWFEGADRTNLPMPAMVMQTGGPNQIDVIFWTPTGGDNRRLRNIRHIDDQVLKNNMAMRNRDGAWDWIPGQQRPDCDEGPSQRPEDTVRRALSAPQSHNVPPAPKEEVEEPTLQKGLERKKRKTRKPAEKPAEKPKVETTALIADAWQGTISRMWEEGLVRDEIYKRMIKKGVDAKTCDYVIDRLPSPAVS